MTSKPQLLNTTNRDEISTSTSEPISVEETIGDGNSVPCPHCGQEQTYSGDALGDSDEYESECSDCGKSFVWVGNTTFYFTARDVQ